MIDYFTREELIHFQYAIISAKIPNQGRCDNVVKVNSLYPDFDSLSTYDEYKDEKIAEKLYFEMLQNEDGGRKDYKETPWADYTIYKTFINPLNKHFDIIILCDKMENIWVDFLCKYMKKKFAIEVIDLNKLFSEGKIGPIYIDRKEIWNKSVDVKKSAIEKTKEGLEQTRGGRIKLIGMMSKKEKISKLKEIGIKVTSIDDNNLDALLIDSWADELNDSEDNGY
jgi:hypothetical protein